MTKTGLDLIPACWPRRFRNKRVGLLCHPASINAAFEHASDVFLRMKELRLTAFFGPQHGIRGETQANMIEWKGFRDPRTGRMTYSLYGTHRKPTPAMLADVDVLVCDLFDVGSRYYTYIWTLLLCMEACAEQGKSLVVLDRPNPINGVDTEGPVLDPAFASFVGLKPLPIRHGLTIGEIAGYFKAAFVPAVDLHVVKMTGWKRAMFYHETGLPWAMPSPNIPTLESALVYPGMCLFEAINVSEGRGTTRPFEIFGAPFIRAEVLGRDLNRLKLPGVVFRPLYFKPTFDKYTGVLCGGAQMHIADPRCFKPFLTAVAIIQTVRRLYPGKLKWLPGPYEYEARKRPIDILFGSDKYRKAIEQGKGLRELERSWNRELNVFKRKRRGFFLY